MEFWKVAFDMGCIGEEKLRKVVISETCKYGYITKEEFKQICGKEFEVIEQNQAPTTL